MEDLGVQVLQGFKVKAKRIIKEKSYYICNTDRGYRVIRKSLDSEKHIMFEHEIKEHLYHSGFLYLDRFAVSVQNKPYVEYDSNYYVMTELLNFRESNFYDNQDFRKIVSAAARMHSIARDINFQCEIPKRTNNILELYRKSISDMEAIKKRVGMKRRLSDFDVLFIKNYAHFSEQMHIALMLLEKTVIQSKIAWARKHSTVCHNLLKDEYILIDNDNTYITGFTQASIDYQILDLCAILNRYARNLPEPCLPISDILELYDRINPLNQEDLDILYALLKYPGKYVKIGSQYYSKKRTWTPNSIINRIEGIVGGRKKFEAWIDSDY